MLAHVPDLNDFVAGMKILLKPGGVITMEFPHLMRLIEDNQWDTIYHEHFSYFSFLTVSRVFEAHGLRLFDVEELPTHGGSLRIYGCHAEDTEKPETRRGRASCAERERQAGYEQLDTYLGYGQRVEGDKRQILRFLIELKRQGLRVVGYGAPAKGNTLLNYCGVGATSSTTRATSTRTSRATSCPAATSRSARPMQIREDQARRRADPAVEPQGRDRRAARLHPRVGWPVRRTHAGAALCSRDRGS